MSFTGAYFSHDRDRAVKVYVNDVAVVATNAQSDYARPLNFDPYFTVVAATLGTVKTFDVSLTYANKIIPYEAGAAKGTTPGFLNFDGNHFDVSSLSSNMYTVTTTGWVKVNALAIAPLSIANATNNEAVTVASGSSITNLTFNNDEVNVYLNGTLVTSSGPRALNFSTSFTATDDSANDRVTIGLGSGFLPDPLSGKKWGLVYGAQNTSSPAGVSFGDGLFNMPYALENSGSSITGGYDATHGPYIRYLSGNGDNDAIKVESGGDITNRAANPHLYGKIRINTLADHRFFFGFNTGTVPDNDDNFLDSLQGFAIGYQYDTAGGSPNTTWQILRNSGAASTTKTSSGITIAAGTVFTFELVGDAANSRWGWNVNGGAFTYYTTAVPTTGNQKFTWRFEQIGGGTTEIDIFYLYWTQDK